MELPKPNWLPNERKYKPGIITNPRESLLATSTERGLAPMWVVRDFVLPVSTGSIDILVVGVGLEDLYYQCSYEPYLVASELEAHNRDYRIDLLDKNKKVLNDVKGRGRIIISAYLYDNREGHRDGWNAYLANTGQRGIMIPHTSNLVQLTQYDPVQAERITSHGFFVANIPVGFKHKRDIGEIGFIEGDVVSAKIGSERYDFISCLNVFLYLNIAGQKLAMYNLARSLRQDGFMIVSDSQTLGLPENSKERSRYAGQYMFAQRGGWLTPERIADLGLKLEDYLEERMVTAVLRRVM